MTLDADDRITSVRNRVDALRQQTDTLVDHTEDGRRMRAEVDALARELDGLRVAMSTRAVIEQAKGMLMLRHGCDDDAAFARLVELSQTTHRKLVDVARTLVTTWSGAGGDART